MIYSPSQAWNYAATLAGRIRRTKENPRLYSYPHAGPGGLWIDSQPASYAASRSARFRFLIGEAVAVCDGGIAALSKFPGTMPVQGRIILAAMVRAQAGGSRKTWRWTPEARARLSASRTGAKRDLARDREKRLAMLAIAAL